MQSINHLLLFVVHWECQVELCIICKAVIWDWIAWLREVVYMAKRTSPSTEPWGTPLDNWWNEDVFPWHDFLKEHPLRSDRNQESIESEMPMFDSLASSMMWLTIFKAADRIPWEIWGCCLFPNDTLSNHQTSDTLLPPYALLNYKCKM